MNKTFKKIIFGIISVSLFVISPLLSHATFYPTGDQTHYLQGGISTSATTIYLSSFTEPISGVPYTMSYLNSSIEYGTLDPQNLTRSEFISFTGITQNSDGSAILTGVTRGLSRSWPFTASTTLSQTHAAQAQFIMADNPQVFFQYPAKQNNETVTGSWSFPAPTSSSSPATQAYVLQTISGTSTLKYNGVVVQGNASGTITIGSIVFFDKSSAEWAKANASISTNVQNVLLGIAQGAGTNGTSINGGILIKGLDANQSGLTPGNNYYISTSSAGSITSNVTVASVGAALSSTQIYFDPYYINATFNNSNNTLTGNNTFTGTNTFNGFSAFSIGKNFYIASTTGTSTFTLPSGVTNIFVQVQGGGGGGGGGNGSTVCGGGGGAGGYAMAPITLTGTTTLMLVVGSTVNFTTIGSTSALYWYTGTSTLTGTTTIAGIGGGTAGDSLANPGGGQGGIATGGYLNVTGGAGGNGLMTGSNTGLGGGLGGASYFGGGGLGGLASGQNGQTGAYGSGGGGGAGPHGGGLGAQGIIIISW